MALNWLDSGIRQLSIPIIILEPRWKPKLLDINTQFVRHFFIWPGTYADFVKFGKYFVKRKYSLTRTIKCVGNPANISLSIKPVIGVNIT